jgi:hypothetical protein
MQPLGQVVLMRLSSSRRIVTRYDELTDYFIFHLISIQNKSKGVNATMNFLSGFITLRTSRMFIKRPFAQELTYTIISLGPSWHIRRTCHGRMWWTTNPLSRW